MMKKYLLVGIDKYKNGYIPPLDYCKNDITEWEKLLKSLNFTPFCDAILDEQATLKSVKSTIENFMKSIGKNDVGVFVFSGHGVQYIEDPTKFKDENGGKDEYVQVYDGEIVDDELRILFDTNPNRGLLVFIADSCHSGVFDLDNEAYKKNLGKSLGQYMSLRIEENILGNTFKNDIIKKNIFIKSFSIDELKPPDDVIGKTLLPEITFSACDPMDLTGPIEVGGVKYSRYSYYLIQTIKKNPNITYDRLHLSVKDILNKDYKQKPQLIYTEENLINQPVFSENNNPITKKNMATIYPRNMKDINKYLSFSFMIDDSENFQIAHTEISPEKGLVILIRFAKVTEKFKNVYTVEQLEVLVIHSFSEKPNEYFELDLSAPEPVRFSGSTENNDFHGTSMVDLDVMIKTAALPSVDVPKYTFAKPFIIAKGQKLHLSAYINGVLNLEPKNVGGHNCNGTIGSTGG